MSFVLQETSRRHKCAKKKKNYKKNKKKKLHTTSTTVAFYRGAVLSSDGLASSVEEQAALSPAHCGGLSPGPSPVCRLTDSLSAAFLIETNSTAALVTETTNLALTGCASSVTGATPLPFIQRAAFNAVTRAPEHGAECPRAIRLRNSTCANAGVASPAN